MNTRVTTYNPLKVNVSLGNHIVSGFADDSFIAIEPNGEGTKSKVGCDGEVTRSIDVNKTYKVKIVLSQNSASNKFMIEQFEKDKADGTGTFPVTINDLSGKTKFAASVGWVSKMSSYGYGKEAGNREWEIETGPADIKQS